MPDLRVLLCGPAMDLAESEARLDMMQDVNLPGATKFVVTTGKFDTQKKARAFNIEASYPSEPACLQTLDRWAEPAVQHRAVLRDGYDIYCLRRILGEHDSFDFAVLLRDAANLESRWPELVASVAGLPFLTFCASEEAVQGDRGPNILFDLKDRRAEHVLELAVDLFLSGAAYAIADYSIQRVLDLALEASVIAGLMTATVGECQTSRTSDAAGLSEGQHPQESLYRKDRISV